MQIDCSKLLVAHGAALLVLQPRVDAFAVVLVTTLRQLLVLLEFLEYIEAYGAGLFLRVARPHPGSLPDHVDLCL